MQGAGNAKLSLVPLPETSDYPVAKVVKKQQIRNRNDHTILKLSGFLYGCRLYIFFWTDASVQKCCKVVYFFDRCLATLFL